MRKLLILMIVLLGFSGCSCCGNGRGRAAGRWGIVYLAASQNQQAHSHHP